MGTTNDGSQGRKTLKEAETAKTKVREKAKTKVMAKGKARKTPEVPPQSDSKMQVL